MIGYGLFVFGRGIRLRFRKKTAWLGLLPALLTLAAYFAGYLIYERQAYGNLVCEPNYTVNMKRAELTVKCDLEGEEKKGEVYQASVADSQELERRAQEILAALGTQPDESRTIEYDDVTVYYSEDERYNLWLYKRGLTYSLTDFSVFDDDFQAVEKENATEKELREALLEIGITVPKEAVLEENGEGRYSFAVPMCKGDNGMLLDGSIRLTYYEDGFISDLGYEVMEFEDCGEEALISQQEAYEKIAAGKFSYSYSADRIDTLLVKAVSLGYELDSKGFYQPVYSFACEINGEDAVVWIPALMQ